ncbi:MAG: hypothetical protein KIT45_07240 [Fimbriimonadia bacterium]|nr:hypothetical protein [Fimbriimonadia bacterium]
MLEQTIDLNDPNPEGRNPIPESYLPELIPVFQQMPEVKIVVALTVNIDDVLQSEAMFGIWVEESLPQEDKLEVLRRLGAALHDLTHPNYYLDLMLMSPRDEELWYTFLGNANLIYAQSETLLRQVENGELDYPPFDDEERDIDVLRVL